MFDKLRERFSRKHDDFDIGPDDIRSGVLGREMDYQPPALTKGLDDFSSEPRQPVRVPDALADIRGPSRYGEPIALDANMSGDRGFDNKTGRDYDILDKLSLIESQLSAIRSQTEMINERLKNLEMRMGYRRY